MRQIRQKRPASRRRRTSSAAVTIHDVAARAGVSVATVSRVLNGKAPVKEETAAQVLEIARSLRYVPNVAARSLSSRRHHTIGVVLPDVHGEFFSEVIRGIDVAARKEGYHILVSGSHSDPGELEEVLDAMHGRVDGVIVMSPEDGANRVQDQIRDHLPLVLLNAHTDGHDTVTIDNYGGAHAMVEPLSALGHTHIAFIRGPEHNADARERLRGYRHAMRRLLRGGTRALELAGDFSEESGFVAGKAIAVMTPRPTAVFAANDSMAVGALGAFSAASLRVPDDVAVAGFDDIPIARYVAPPLTTVHVDIAEIGRRAFDLLSAGFAHPRSRTRRQESVATSLVIRKSCGGGRTETTQIANQEEES